MCEWSLQEFTLKAIKATYNKILSIFFYSQCQVKNNKNSSSFQGILKHNKKKKLQLFSNQRIKCNVIFILFTTRAIHVIKKIKAPVQMARL